MQNSLYVHRNIFLPVSKTGFYTDMQEFYDRCLPGDIFKIGNQSVIRMQPLVAPVLHEINAYVHYFFVPYRILWDDWEDFISGGVDGQFADPIPEWEPTITTEGSLLGNILIPHGRTSAFVWSDQAPIPNLSTGIFTAKVIAFAISCEIDVLCR